MVDVWCLGVSLYVMIARALPFDGEEANETRKNIKKINYEMKSFFSAEVEEVFRKIFVEEEERASIEELEKTDFVKNRVSISPNFINVDEDKIMVDPQILSVIEAEFKLDPDEVSESVTKLKLDSNFSLYYLTVQR
jgi:hypothetical protein